MAHGGAPVRKKTHDALHAADDDDDDEVPVPPDGGWGWVVVFGSFMIHVITDGMTYSFGLFYKEFLDEFKEGNGYTAWIISMLAGVTLCSGPISAKFVNQYGCRNVTIAGALLAGCSLIASMFAQNVLTLIFTIGIGTGLGLGLIYLPAIVSVTTYFEKYRSLATGIAVCGSGFGTFVFAPLTEILITKFTWRGALLVIAIIVLNCILFGALFRPLEPKKRSKDEDAERAQRRATRLADVGELDEEELYDESPSDHQYSNGQQPDANRRSSLQKSSSFKTGGDGTMVRSQSVGHSLVKGGHRSGARVHYDDNHNNGDANRSNGSNGNANGTVNVNDNSNGNAPSARASETLRSALSQPFLNDNADRLHFKSSHRSIAKSGTMSRPDILYQGSLLNIHRSVHDVSHTGTVGSDADRYGSFRPINGAPSVDSETHNDANGDSGAEGASHCCGVIKRQLRTFAQIMSFDLFADPIFIVFTVSNFCTSIGFNVPYVYMAVRAGVLDISPSDASQLISIIGIANTVGRIVLGYLADKPWVNRLTVYNWCLTTCGIATALSVFCTDFHSLAVYAIVFGFTIGAYVGLTSVILVDLLGLDKLTNAFGLLLLCQGIATLIGPPMAGTLYDLTLSYSPGFILAGVTIAVSGFVLFAIPPMQRHLERRIGNGPTEGGVHH